VQASHAERSGVQPGDRERQDVDRELFARLVDRGDPAARDALVERLMPLARSLARRFASRGESFEDIFQVACVGLVKAIDRFDPGRGGAFSSFAVPTIAGEIKRYYRDRTWTVHLPRDLQELVLRVGRAAEALERELRRKPTVGELARRLELTEEDVLEALQAGHAKRARSLDAPPREDGDDAPSTVGAALGAEDGGFACAERREILRGLMVVLSARERLVLSLRFEQDLTQEEIGERVGVSQMQVSRILRQALCRLHDHALHQGLTASEGDLALIPC
jgi:RNA polymerase sigma-B factor